MTKHAFRKVRNFRHLLGCDTIEDIAGIGDTTLVQSPKVN